MTFPVMGLLINDGPSFNIRQMDTTVIELTSTSLEKELEMKLKNIKNKKAIRNLTIQINENKSKWIVISKPYSINNEEIKSAITLPKSIDSIPQNISKFTQLKILNLSYLGLTFLPKLNSLKNLETLDLSFNKFNLDNEMDNILELKNLKKLKIYGCNVNSDTIEKLKKTNSNLTILNDLNNMDFN